MTIYKAKKLFKDGLKYVRSDQNREMYDLLAGLLQLTEGLESEIQRLHQDIARVSQQVAELHRR